MAMGDGHKDPCRGENLVFSSVHGFDINSFALEDAKLVVSDMRATGFSRVSTDGTGSASRTRQNGAKRRFQQAFRRSVELPGES
jgi:hypothetical protein